jgi:hypothetical protein
MTDAPPFDPDDLNRDCTCMSLDQAALLRSFEGVVGDIEFGRRLSATHPTLISQNCLFLSAGHVARMAEIIATIERVARLPAYAAAVAAEAGDAALARFRPGAVGVLMGYDFHLSPKGPRLIEINTNAGGALINAYVARAQRACCASAEAIWAAKGEDVEFETLLVESFRRDWGRQMGARALASIAIVDDAPETQFLYPEFVLFERLFRRFGLWAGITDPRHLTHRDGALWLQERRIDLVYNRLTDFSLGEPAHAALRSAYLAGDAVFTPNPWAHAMLADKRNLVRLTDAGLLRDWGVAEADLGVLLAGIPRTRLVTAESADALWKERNGLFFKPVSGFGSKAAYRGDKLTTKVWQHILTGGYVAQELVPPSARTVVVDDARQVMKVDVRNYCYDGEVQMVAARLYQGQTTNFRTPGGGFAPVLWAKGAKVAPAAAAIGA